MTKEDGETRNMNVRHTVLTKEDEETKNKINIRHAVLNEEDGDSRVGILNTLSYIYLGWCTPAFTCMSQEYLNPNTKEI